MIFAACKDIINLFYEIITALVKTALCLREIKATLSELTLLRHTNAVFICYAVQS